MLLTVPVLAPAYKNGYNITLRTIALLAQKLHSSDGLKRKQVNDHGKIYE